MNRKTPSAIRKLLPWYANGTLPAREMRMVDRYLRQNPEALKEVDVYRQYRLRLKSWAQHQPSPQMATAALRRARLSQAPTTSRLHPYAWGAALAILIILWLVVRPGVVLEWDNARGEVSEFYIYRMAENGEAQRIGTISATAEAEKYTYVDTMLLPWESYTYIVEGVQGESVRALSGSVERDALAVFPVQVMLAAFSLVLGYGVASLMQRSTGRFGGTGVTNH